MAPFPADLNITFWSDSIIMYIIDDGMIEVHFVIQLIMNEERGRIVCREYVI